ncbi:MAG: hypothetical protein RBS22_04845 [Spongiibacteraceae bacterium]|jgi:predicted lipoprotein with Yx(FWY)xxD motif|nr:hypothetical protein [Spongiibacteraceae bacterium]
MSNFDKGGLLMSGNRGFRRYSAFRRTAFSIVGVLGVLALLAGCSSAGHDAVAVTDGPARVHATAFGPVLATPDGRTLYWWPRDEATPGQSQCTNIRHASYKHVTGRTVYLPHPETRKTCEEKWPPFLAAEDAKPQGKWSIIERHDKSRQWAFNGRPLHLSVKDSKAGDVNGLNVTGRNYGGWKPAMAPLQMPPGIELLRLREGVALVTHDRRALYTPSANSSPCMDCSDSPEPLAASALVNRVGEWTVVEAAGDLRQYAFRGKPVFVGKLPVTDPDPVSIKGWDAIFFTQAMPEPDAIRTRFSLIGDIYTSREGMALYVFSCQEGPESVPCDDPGDAAAHWSILCGAADVCAQRWHPYVAEPGAEGLGEWSIMSIPHPVYTDPLGYTYADDNDNPVVSVWAYRGRPVYTFEDDSEPGIVLGHEISGLPGSGFFAIQAPGNHEKTLSQ